MIPVLTHVSRAYAFSSSTEIFNDYTMLCASEWTSSTSITFTWLSFEDKGTSTAKEYTVTSSGTAGMTTHTTSVKLATEQRLSGRVLHAMGIQISSTVGLLIQWEASVPRLRGSL